MKEQQLSISQLYHKGKNILKERGIDWIYPGGKIGLQVKANRKYLDSLFIEPKLFDPVDVDISFTAFGLN